MQPVLFRVFSFQHAQPPPPSPQPPSRERADPRPAAALVCLPHAAAMSSSRPSRALRRCSGRRRVAWWVRRPSRRRRLQAQDRHAVTIHREAMPPFALPSGTRARLPAAARVRLAGSSGAAAAGIASPAAPAAIAPD
eukprot:170242-Chlamydomonas_euryale.AAC.13